MFVRFLRSSRDIANTVNIVFRWCGNDCSINNFKVHRMDRVIEMSKSEKEKIANKNDVFVSLLLQIFCSTQNENALFTFVFFSIRLLYLNAFLSTRPFFCHQHPFYSIRSSAYIWSKKLEATRYCNVFYTEISCTNLKWIKKKIEKK